MAAAVLIGLTALLYLPSLFNGYIWDDDSYVFDSNWSKSDRPLRSIWLSRTETPQYYPLVFTLFRAGQRFWGFEPFGFHLVSIVLHIANALLVLAVTKKLYPGAAFAAALLFAIHPIQVETVAWITEAKNLLCLFFFLLACLVFMAYDENERPRDYVLTLLFFLLAIFSKSVAVCFVTVPVLYRWWRRGAITRKDILISLPFVVIGAAGAINTIWIELHHVNTKGAQLVIPFADRLILLGRTTLFYLYKTLIPGDFVFFYPRWHIDPGQIGQWLYTAAAVALLTALIMARNRIGRGPAALFLFYCISIFPASGMFDVFPMIYSYVADHFSYLSTPAIFLMAVSGFMITADRLKERYSWVRGKSVRTLSIGAAATVLMFLGMKTVTLQANYKNEVALWQSVIEKNPGCAAACNNLAVQLEEAEPDRAIALLEKAVALDPGHTNALNNLGTLYLKVAKPGEAIPFFQKAIGKDASRPPFHHNLGIAFLDLKQYDSAIDSLARAIILDPGRHNSITKIVNAINEKQAGGVQSPAAPDKAGSALCFRAGVLVGRQGDDKSARALFREAVARDPGNCLAYNHMGYTYCRAGDGEAAASWFQQALAADPGCEAARRNLEHVQTRLVPDESERTKDRTDRVQDADLPER